MQTFSIRDIENLTAIRAHTLRIWEQRYGFFKAKRKQSQHRYYDNEDLKSLLRVAYLYHKGFKISHIAELTTEQIMRKIDETSLLKTDHAGSVNRLLDAAFDFNQAAFNSILDEVIQRSGFEECMEAVCYPFLQKLGLLWTTNNVIPSQEHFSSYLVQNRIIVETEKLSPVLRAPEILLLCPEGEFHELPLLYINYLLKKNEWSILYLGTDIQKEEIVQMAGLDGIRYVYIHLITNFTGMDAGDYVEDICRSLPQHRIIASGEGFRQVQRNWVNLQLLSSDQQIHAFVQGQLVR